MRISGNTYVNNAGSGNKGGVLTIRGTHFFTIENERYINNTDSYDELFLFNSTGV